MNALLHDSHVWVLISFLLFVGGFAKFGWGKLTAVLDAKITAIKSEIETAEALRTEAQALLNDYRYKQHAAEEEAKQIIAQAHAHADQLKKQLESELEDTAARREAQLAQTHQANGSESRCRYACLRRRSGDQGNHRNHYAQHRRQNRIAPCRSSD